MPSVALYRFSTKIYVFQLKPDNTLEVFFGDRFTDDYTNPNFIDVVKSEKVKLSKDQMIILNEIISQIKVFEHEYILFTDAWEVIIKIDDESFRFNYGAAKDKNMDNLVTKLIEFSPFEIVEGSGYPVKPLDFPEIESIKQKWNK